MKNYTVSKMFSIRWIVMPSGITISLSLLIVRAVTAYIPELRFQWNFVNYTWPDRMSYENAVNDGSYIREHNVISGIKLWKNQLYLAVPRLKYGVPVTLTSIPKDSPHRLEAPLLDPYPDWNMQRIGDCSALQFVQSMEIDPLGRMWVIDNGRINVRNNRSSTVCPPKLVIFDLENKGEILLNYKFPNGVVNPRTVYLNDIVLDHENGGFAYITDNDSKYPGIIIFSLEELRSWKVRHSTMLADSNARDVQVVGTNLSVDSHVDGIALSEPATTPGNRMLYYSPLSSFTTFSIPIDRLKRGDFRELRSLGFNKTSQSDGMVASSSGVLYFGLLNRGAISSWDRKHKQVAIVAQDPDNLQWPDSFAIDADGWLWNTAKRQSAIRTNTMRHDRINFRIFRSFVGQMNYQYFEDGSAPILPAIPNLTLSSILLDNLNYALHHLARRIFFIV